ncbi:ATP-binding cassette domain-containing protein [Rosenbergiella sp. S61]|uniref:ATP-binding cassette domain-containing protein n=1 Tax=Rosenbergiella gaditana TaxID=2726987 RepID=A0ABS5SV79_9GAMM|nr:ATP-binding cassette domain-containing protein [Rosenbergiella gaditana]
MNNVRHFASAPLFELRNVAVQIAGRHILQPVTHTFTPGRVTGLIGHNGSGKSTLLKLLSRQNPYHTGQILWQQRPVSQWPSREFARHVAYLPQQLPPAEGMTVKELVTLGRFAWHGALKRVSPEDLASVDEAIRSVDLEWARDHLVEQLSGGERQRAWLAMCVVQACHCLLLDEPTSALDIAHQKEVLQVIHDLSRTRNLTVIMVLHDINMAARFCDEFVALRQGKTVFKGDAQALMTAEQLSAIYHVPMGVTHPDRDLPPISYVK